MLPSEPQLAGMAAEFHAAGRAQRSQHEPKERLAQLAAGHRPRREDEPIYLGRHQHRESRGDAKFLGDWAHAADAGDCRSGFFRRPVQIQHQRQPRPGLHHKKHDESARLTTNGQ